MIWDNEQLRIAIGREYGGSCVEMDHDVKKRWIVTGVLLVIAAQLFMRAVYDIENNGALGERIYSSVMERGVEVYAPYMLYTSGEWKRGSIVDRLWRCFCKDMPLQMCALERLGGGGYMTDFMQPDEKEVPIIEDDLVEQFLMENHAAGGNGEGAAAYDRQEDLEQAVLAENTAAAGVFVPVRMPVAVYSEQQLRTPGFIRETFYSVDATTDIREEQLDYDTLMGFDASIGQDASNVQILVYHTHSQEAYIDSAEGDPSTSIVGVGEHLCEILRTQYGFNVLHHTGEYDIEGRDYAYSNAMKGLDQVLAENPTIEVMIDLHRDATSADTRLVTTVQDKAMARFMFFNGLCYTKGLGELTSLPNPYVQDNLSFAFQMQLTAEQYYPGLTRRIYLKGYRYNLHYRPKSLLIELGSQTNTVEEAMNACEPLAHVIAMVLNPSR